MLNGKKTFAGIIMMVLALLANKGIIPALNETETQAIIEVVFGIGGALLAAYGRWDVERRLTKNK